MGRTEQFELIVNDDPGWSGRTIVSGVIRNVMVNHYGPAILDQVSLCIAQKMADEFIKMHGQDILAKMNVQALANLAVAEAGADTAKAIRTSGEAIGDALLRSRRRGLFG